MCGLAGILNLNGQLVSPEVLRGMTDSIAHRGPDGEGLYLDKFIGLGHRRLAIIDLSAAGHQPMTTADKRYAIVYNGEVYNFLSIRKELESLGYSFHSKTDSEVVLNAYVHWGQDCVKHFNGMFAFAVWDKNRQDLFLARDRYGIKPLYYKFSGSTFIFASEQKAILVHPSVGREIDLEALLEYFTFQNIFTDKTLLKGITMFPPGCYANLPVGCDSNRLKIVRYWDYDFAEPETADDENAYIEELDRLFCQAVSRQLVSDVDIGSYLSGGVDSGSITAIAARHLPYIKTFTCGFDLRSASGIELNFDERRSAEYLSYIYKTEHYEMVLKSGDMERILPLFTWHLEEPRVGQSYPNFYISGLASKFVKVVLSGVGGDELFGGYPWRYYRAADNSTFEHYIDNHYAFWQRLIPNKLIKEVFRPIWNEVKHVWTRDIFRNVFYKRAEELTRPEDYINHSLYLEAKTFLHGLLVVEDKLSMGHSLETRVPFLDNDLVDFAMKIPVSMKLKNLNEVVKIDENEPAPKNEKYFLKTRDGKLILRKVMEKYIPKEMAGAIKQGFSAPDASWFKGESIDYVKRMLFNDKASIYNYFDRNTIKGLITEHLEGKKNRRLLIWSLLNFENWCKIFLNGDVAGLINCNEAAR
ncbi:asparagine synthase (glutamine-hydrolyzing) [Candidatus Magnetominusculus xianensis]|uniref:asparagine synthase (glutamine-hydrolyzing) n=1 Tax=Candidatus Magnetominusculus xianensis TaxID=1748249 RepID=A0ABR5SLZ3_9BACT|nr:asparagine synthase (glutamine-hydrolyzing) [Candidatus Magnetominusculus xianensis]KWT91564.1 asparagine synthetase B [Candidatus Magnetominusculus xianensis]MBF0404350.1 asparagine synthase (glutamine-hydrolyzing) [Nitrospirota bacterium]